jgi:hypothetical protein
MNVGDLVIRKVPETGGNRSWNRHSAKMQRRKMGHGLILTKQMSGTPRHPCITVLYPKTGEMYDIAESLMEVISESR